ncbi:MAG: hypothetical protein HGB36_10545, partial [Chlorobiaceae bacterium]|nr:hypothetical protein [Chlorobiaceae bacterium]
TIKNIENILGGTGNDTLTGDGSANYLYGGDGADSLAGGAGNDTLAGGGGNDSLAGGASNDVLLGGAGDDTLIYDASDTGIGAVDGGIGQDTLLVNQNIDFNASGYNVNRFINIEVLDLSGANVMLSNLDPTDVSTITGGGNSLYIVGSSGDSVSGGGWTAAGQETTTIGGTSHTFDIYNGTGGVTLKVEQDIARTL